MRAGGTRMGVGCNGGRQGSMVGVQRPALPPAGALAGLRRAAPSQQVCAELLSASRALLPTRTLPALPPATRIELDHQPSQWRLSPALAGALGIKGHHSVPFVMQMLWGYIKAKQLYEVGAWGG